MHFSREQYNLCNQDIQYNGRIPSPNRITVPFGYQVDVAVQGLDAPIGIVFDDNGDLLIAESGLASGEPRVLRITN